jgi:hypothetical protein
MKALRVMRSDQEAVYKTKRYVLIKGASTPYPGANIAAMISGHLGAGGAVVYRGAALRHGRITGNPNRYRRICSCIG